MHMYDMRILDSHEIDILYNFGLYIEAHQKLVQHMKN